MNMAIELIGAIQRWIGLSTDAKPVSDVKPGVVFYETDTQKEFIYTTAGWVEIARPYVLTSRNLRETQIGADQDLTWANSDAVDTQKVHTFTKPANPIEEYMLICYNPSAVTELTVKIFNIETNLKGADRDVLLTTISVPRRQTVTGTTIEAYARIIHGIFNGGNCKIVVSNDFALGASDGFTATFRLREVM